MTEPDLIGLFIEPLERLGVHYMITGGVAAVVYGDPRFTRDIDIVMELPRATVPRLEDAFAGGDFYVPPRETLLEEAARAGHFNLIHRDTALRADVYLVGADPFHRWALSHRQRIAAGALAIWVAPIEYVIVRKLQYYRESASERHLRDIAMMLRISGDRIDPAQLESWAARLGLGEQLERARAHQPD